MFLSKPGIANTGKAKPLKKPKGAAKELDEDDIAAAK
jgi:hypothetical protein